MTVLDHRSQLSRGRLIASRVGLVLALLMSLPNVVNGALQVIDGPPTVDGEPTPAWVGISLLVAGVVTIAAFWPAWKGAGAAIWLVALARISELSALTVFLGWFPAEDAEKPFYVVIAAVGLAIGLLVLLGLRPNRDVEGHPARP